MLFNAITFDQIVLALMATISLRELLILFLPDRIAGPGGWLVDTGEDEENSGSF